MVMAQIQLEDWLVFCYSISVPLAIYILQGNAKILPEHIAPFYLFGFRVFFLMGMAERWECTSYLSQIIHFNECTEIGNTSMLL